MTERDRTRLIPVEDRKRELIAARHTARVTRRYGTSHEPTPDEPAVYPVFLAADDVIGLIAYGRTTALKGPVPGAPRMFERWKSHVIGGSTYERQYFLVRQMRLVLARVRWWQSRRRMRMDPAKCPIKPLDRSIRGHVRWVIRSHGRSAVETVALLRADVRQLLAAKAGHEIAIERATANLCAEIAAEHIVAYGRRGVWRNRRFTSGIHEQIPAVFFANPHNTIQYDGWATCGWDVTVQHWADWNGPDWGDVRFKRDDAFKFFGEPISGRETMDGDSDASRTTAQASQGMTPADGWPHANSDVEDIQRAARRKVEEIRARRIERFTQRQRKLSDWVCFADVADWCARITGDIKPDEERRTLTYSELRKSLTVGDFEQAGRSRVMFLNPATTMAKMTRVRFDLITRAFDGQTLNTEYLSCCWIPRDLCQQWFDSRRLPTPRWLVRTQASTVPRTQAQPKYPWTKAPDAHPPAVACDADPTKLPLWLTAMQAVAWVCTRNISAIWRADLERDHRAPPELSQDFVEEWFPPGKGVTLLTLDAWHGASQGKPDWLIPTDPALCQMINWFRAGMLQSSGINRGGDRVSLDPADWRDMVLSESEDVRELVPHRAPPRSGKDPRWHAVLVFRDDLLRLYPPRLSEAGAATPVAGSVGDDRLVGPKYDAAAADGLSDRVGTQQQIPLSRAEMRRWYEARVRGWPPRTKHPSEAQDWEDAKEAFGLHRVTRDSVRALRRALAPPEWTAHGRRKLARE